MILNILLGLLLLWISRQYVDKMKPGAVFAGWLVFAGLARTFIEFFRPDQPLIGDSFVTYSMLVSFLMAIIGVIILLVRYGKLQVAFAEGWEEEYQLKPVVGNPRIRTRVIAEDILEDAAAKGQEEDNEDEVVSKPVERKSAAKAKLAAKSKAKPATKARGKTAVKAKPVTKKGTAKSKETKR
jgi:hypothetical protein